MRRKIKCFWSVIIVCGMVFFTACEPDSLEEDLPKSGTSAIVKKLTREELQTRFSVMEKLEEIESGFRKRTIDSGYDFTVETDEIVYIEKGNQHSYTFLITTDKADSGLETLVLEYKSGMPTTYRITYDTTFDFEIKTVQRLKLYSGVIEKPDYTYYSKKWQNNLGLNLEDYRAMLYELEEKRQSNIASSAETMRKLNFSSHVIDELLGLTALSNVMEGGLPPGDYYDKNGKYLGNDGIDDNKIYQLKADIRPRFENTNVNWGKTLSKVHYQELQAKSNDLGLAEMQMVFTGEANSKNPRQADGQLNIVQIAGGKEFTRASFDAIGGPWGNGSPENGNYLVNTLKDRSPSGWHNEGMTKDGIGFSLNIDPQFKTGRTELRIHPDGGKYSGTQGCIGLTGDKTELLDFRDLAQSALSVQKNRPLNVKIQNNLNNNGYDKKVKSNGE